MQKRVSINFNYSIIKSYSENFHNKIKNEPIEEYESDLKVNHYNKSEPLPKSIIFKLKFLVNDIDEDKIDLLRSLNIKL